MEVHLALMTSRHEDTDRAGTQRKKIFQAGCATAGRR
jgi:hypothetical protein